MVRRWCGEYREPAAERGCDPRKVGHDAWESRCPAHRGLDHALSITRNEFNHVVLTCRSTENCAHLNIIRALGFTNELLYAETPDWLISQLRRVAVEPEERAEMRDQGWEQPEISPMTQTKQPRFCVTNRRSARSALIPEIVAETNGAASPSGNETSHAVALASDRTRRLKPSRNRRPTP